MTSFIQVPDNLKDKPLRVVSNKYISDEDDREKVILEQKVEMLQNTIMQLNETLNALSNETQSGITENGISYDGDVIALSGEDSTNTLVVAGDDDAESEERHWADGTVTKDYRQILCDCGTECTDYFAYDFQTGQELFDTYQIRRIERTMVDDDIIQTTVLFCNGEQLKITGLNLPEFGGPFTKYYKMSYSLSYSSQLYTNSFTGKKSAWTILSINTYDNNGNDKVWISLYLENGKLTSFKREFIN